MASGPFTGISGQPSAEERYFRSVEAVSVDVVGVDNGGVYNPKPFVLRTTTAWLGPIHVHPTAPSETEDLADELKRILNTMCPGGDDITVDNETTGDGILIGTFAEWEDDNYGFPGTVPSFIYTDEQYVIVASHRMLRILGVDDAAVERAVFKFLDLLGYRHLMPTDTWEVIPSRDSVTVRIAVIQSPAINFLNGMGDAGGIMSDGADRLDVWQRHNQIPTGGYRFGHAYGQIILANDEEFDSHPEYVGSSNKLCVFEPAVQAFALEFAQDAIELDSGIYVMNLTAADGTQGWDTVCTGTDEQATYSPSDRQATLANYVQEQLDLDLETYRGVRCSLLAYGSTSVDLNIDLDPRIVVGVTDGFIQGGQTWAQVVAAYQAKGAVDVVPYTYGSVWQTNPGLPGNSRLSNLDKVAIDVERTHTMGEAIKGLLIEAPSSWGNLGLSMWILGRMLIDPTRTDTEELKEEFIEVSFGDQAEIMAPFYDLVLANTPLSEDCIHRMYQILANALADNPTAAVEARVYDLAIYVRYLELYYLWKLNDTVAAFDDLFEHMYRARDRDLVGYRVAYALASNDPWFEELELLYPGYTFTAFSDKPWDDTPFTEGELSALIAVGIDTYALLPFTTLGFSTTLAYKEWPVDARPRGSFVYSSRNHSWYLWMRDDQTDFVITHRGGVSSDLEGSAFLNIIDLSNDGVIHSIEAEIDITAESTVELEPGRLYRMDVVANGGVDFSWVDHHLTKITDFELAPFQADYSGYFMVPVGTSVIGGYAAGGAVVFRDPANTIIYTTDAGGDDYFSFAITPPITDEVWKFTNGNGTLTFLTVPPGIAMDPEELLIPVELVVD